MFFPNYRRFPGKLFSCLGVVCLFFAEACSAGEYDNTFLALGDSYTIGESVAVSQRWPVQLAAQLRQNGVSIDEPKIIAVTGWTTDELQRGIAAEQLHPPYNLVSLLIGVNNQYRGRSLDEYRKEFAELLQQAISYAGNKPQHVIVLSIPDWGVTPFATGRNRAQIAREIDQFNAAKRQITEKVGAHYIDITPVSRQQPKLVAADGLHPSGEMYSKWVELALPVASKIVKTPQK